MNHETPSEAPAESSPRYIRFAAIKATVVQGSERVAIASTSTMARRIANALNRYKPGEKGY